MWMIISEKKKETIIILYLHHIAPCAYNKPEKATLRLHLECHLISEGSWEWFYTEEMNFYA